MDFEDWMTQVNALFQTHYSCHSDDVEDWLWYDSWQAGLSAEEAFEDWEEEQRRYL